MKKCTSFEEQKGTRYIRENVYFCIIIFSCLSSTKQCLRFLLNCYCSRDKRWGSFQGYNERFPNILAKSWNYKKLRQFSRRKSTDNNDYNIVLSLENPCNVLLEKEKTLKRIFNINSELSQNCTEKQIMLFKTKVNCLFNDICYLVIGCFDWKIGVFQQTVVRGLLYP